MKKFNAFMLTVMVSLFFTACSNDDKPVNEEEVITTVIATFVGGGQTITLTSRDLDGDGPNPPQLTQTGGNFINGVTYTGSLTFLNELENPVEDITIEIEEEDDEHQVFFQINNDLGSFTYTDTDANGNPLGLSFTFTTQNTGSGQLTITLIHEPNKNASGVADGDITNAGGETDAEVSFEVVVQ